jgi:hypothetical protein
MTTKRILSIISIIVVSIILIIIINFVSSHSLVQVNFENTSSVVAYSDKDRNNKIAVSRSGDRVWLAKDIKYSIEYKGSNGYANGNITAQHPFDTISIKPDYSAEKYKSLMSAALPDINSLIQDKYPKAKESYAIQPKAMRDFGKWFLIALKYTKEYSTESDTLYILATKDNSKWTLKTNAEVFFRSNDYRSINTEILSWANEQIIK